MECEAWEDLRDRVIAYDDKANAWCNATGMYNSCNVVLARYLMAVCFAYTCGNMSVYRRHYNLCLNTHIRWIAATARLS